MWREAIVLSGIPINPSTARALGFHVPEIEPPNPPLDFSITNFIGAQPYTTNRGILNTPIMTPETASPHVWQRIAEATQQQYPEDLELTAIRVEHHFTGEEKLPHPQHVIETVEQQAKDHGIIL